VPLAGSTLGGIFDFFGKIAKVIGGAGGLAAAGLGLSKLGSLFGFLGKLALRAGPIGAILSMAISLDGTDWTNLVEGVKESFEKIKNGEYLEGVKQLIMTPINFAVTAYKKTVDSLSEWIESFGIDEGMSDLLANLALGGTLIIGFRKSILAIVRSVGTIARIAGRLFVPLTVVITLFETIKGAIEGWNEDGFVGALKGAITEFGATLIAVPLDFIKGISAWVLEQLGFDETAEALNDFSFEEIWRNTVSAFFEGVKSMVEWVKLKFTDVTEAIESLWTGLVGAGKDLVSLLWSPIESAINWVKTLFTDPVEAFKQYFSTLLGVYTSIGELLFVPIDSAVTWIKNTFSDIKIEVPEWMKDIGGYLKNKLVKPIADFFEMITNFDFATLVPDWVKDIFGGPTTEVEPLDMIGGGAVDTGAAMATRDLATMSDEELGKQIENNKRILESQLSKPVQNQVFIGNLNSQIEQLTSLQANKEALQAIQAVSSKSLADHNEAMENMKRDMEERERRREQAARDQTMTILQNNNIQLSGGGNGGTAPVGPLHTRPTESRLDDMLLGGSLGIP
jgi:hypothetical protein